jgi:uncharacterized protein (TIGR02145 family)
MLDAVEGNTTFTQSPLDGAYRGTQAGQLLKYAGTYTASKAELRPEWLNDAYPGTDQYAFRALPSGGRTSAGYTFDNLGSIAYWISSSVAVKDYGHRVYLSNNQPGALLTYNTYSWGQAIRCIKD